MHVNDVYYVPQAQYVSGGRATSEPLAICFQAETGDKLSSKLNASHKCVLAARGQAREMKRTISALEQANVYRRYCRLQTQ